MGTIGPYHRDWRRLFLLIFFLGGGNKRAGRNKMEELSQSSAARDRVRFLSPRHQRALRSALRPKKGGGGLFARTNRGTCPPHYLQAFAASFAIFSRSASLKALKGLGIETKLAIALPPQRTSKVPFLAFVGLVTTLTPGISSLSRRSILDALLRNTEHGRKRDRERERERKRDIGQARFRARVAESANAS